MEANFPAGPNQPTSGSYGKPQPLTGWATFMGVMIIIGGAFYCLTIIGAVIGVPWIIAGNKLLKAVNASREMSGAANDFRLAEVFDNLNSFFKINGIVAIVLFALSIVFVIVMMALGMSTMLQNGGFNELNNY